MSSQAYKDIMLPAEPEYIKLTEKKRQEAFRRQDLHKAQYFTRLLANLQEKEPS